MSGTTVYIGNDTLIQLDEAHDEQTGAYLNAATVTFNLKTNAGDIVVSDTAMAYVAGSNGKYQGTLQSGTALTANTKYTLEIALSEGGIVGLWHWTVYAKYRSP